MKNKKFAHLVKLTAEKIPGSLTKGSMVIIPPLRDFLRGIYFDRSINKDLFYVEIFFQPLFIPSKVIHFTFGKRIRTSKGSDGWSFTEDDLAGELLPSIINESSRFFQKTETAHDIARFPIEMEAEENIALQQIAAYSWAFAGNTSEALKALNKLIFMIDSDNFKYPWQLEIANRAKVLIEKIQTSPDDYQRQLDVWRDETIKNLKLESLVEHKSSMS